MTASPPTCTGCRHYFITHERDWPHGCRAFGLKSKNPPAIEVEKASGKACEAFEERPPRRPGTQPAGPWPGERS